MRSVAALLILLVLLTGGCRGGGGVGELEPDITGVITAISAGDGIERLGVIRVETVPDDESGSPKASVTITRVTEVLQHDELAPYSVLRQGDRVHVWYMGAVAESYPVQATAQRVVIAGTPR